MIITSISGIRGTIGGRAGEHLTPIDVVNFASGYGAFIQRTYTKPRIVIGRDARKSGEGIAQLVIHTLCAQGIDVIDAGLVPTPTLAVAVVDMQAQGGIIITASHNPKEYNGIKMLNHEGEFLSDSEGKEILSYIQEGDIQFSDTDHLGVCTRYTEAIDAHIQQILALDSIDPTLIASRDFQVVYDPINSVGALAVPKLLEALGVAYRGINDNPDGEFAHLPEPLEKNLEALKKEVAKDATSFGISVDPDVDRLVLVCEDGTMFGEERTLVAAVDMVLSETKGSVVANLSSSQASADIAKQYGVDFFQSKVGEKNVVEKMKEVQAVIGGEGSGGVIYPQLHYGRDALVGIALVLMLLAKRNTSLLELAQTYPVYAMGKRSVALEGIDKEEVYQNLIITHQSHICDTQDGVKIQFENSWVQVRGSNTEPIIRVYTEARTQEEADALAEEYVKRIG